MCRMNNFGAEDDVPALNSVCEVSAQKGPTNTQRGKIAKGLPVLAVPVNVGPFSQDCGPSKCNLFDS